MISNHLKAVQAEQNGHVTFYLTSVGSSLCFLYETELAALEMFPNHRHKVVFFPVTPDFVDFPSATPRTWMLFKGILGDVGSDWLQLK